VTSAWRSNPEGITDSSPTFRRWVSGSKGSLVPKGRLTTVGVFILILALLCGESFATEPFKIIDLWPGTPPGDKGAIGVEHDTTTTKDRPVAGKPVVRLGDVSKPTLTLYQPQHEKATGNAVLVCPGGGYRILATDLEGTEVCDWLNSVGLTAALLKYRVPKREGDDQHQLPLQDAQRAMSLLRHNAKQWGIDSGKIGALGFSAGGHLVANLSNNYDQRAYPNVDDADAASCRPDFSLLIYPAYLVVKDTDRLAPEMKVTEKTPPTFITMAMDDPIRIENALSYAAALRKAAVPFELHVYEGGGHGFGLRPVKDAANTHWPERAAQWLQSRGLARSH
jgi:acetyl esterase/lipase